MGFGKRKTNTKQRKVGNYILVYVLFANIYSYLIDALWKLYYRVSEKEYRVVIVNWLDGAKDRTSGSSLDKVPKNVKNNNLCFLLNKKKLLWPLRRSSLVKQRKLIFTTSATTTKHIQGVHKVRVHFKRFITLFVFAIDIISKKCYEISATWF